MLFRSSRPLIVTLPPMWQCSPSRRRADTAHNQRQPRAALVLHPGIGGQEHPHAFHGRENGTAGKAVIVQPRAQGIGKGQHVQTGKPCQRAMVLASISTGMPLLLVAQCRVKPVQMISPSAARVIR